MDIVEIEKQLSRKIFAASEGEDPAHDFLHFKRVVKTAKMICNVEKAKLEVVIPAAWLHDFVLIPKDDPRRAQASRLSAEEAIEYLREINYPKIYLEEIFHAIEAHSFSANIETRSMEAKIIQDADRLDGLGAIGIARCFATAGLLRRPFYSEIDAFCEKRSVDDGRFTVDHFFAKLFKTVDTLKTQTGRSEGNKRLAVMKKYLHDLGLEIL